MSSRDSSALLAELSDPDRDVRLRAAMTLGELAEPATAEPLAAHLWEEPDFFVRDVLTWSLGRLGSAAVPVAREALGREPRVRTQALHVLSKILDPATLDDIAPLAADSEPAVAAKARFALGRLGDARALPVLLGLLGDDDAEAQNVLTDVLASFGAAAVPGLEQALREGSAPVRRHAAAALGYLGDDARPAVDALDGAAGSDDSALAVSAVMALGSITGPDAAAALERASASDDSRVSAVAARLLSRSSEPTRLDALRAARLARAAG
ncbi:hypothetical protein C5C56_16995 [Rathayibacter sp. AY1D1]|uniref:HEAT repeat domain-containing protein n=1 Tax=unclassified Rathayibacter TaxID=2609250 RepID=UPI000CE80103|nr:MULTISPECIES: HEAT repeat domain-containing protein [unclassified Rathayibacter]PPF09620.1 hypothetical protein C5B98_15185 [Rathayibacter sp. AY1A5]PPH17082.1 hypothetical protein C5C99_15245 [Rathayibacter sp. AY1C4]PPH95287.1 hypothetical protein C5C56_16995 [Rathayibacter sp. AY1D1]